MPVHIHALVQDSDDLDITSRSNAEEQDMGADRATAVAGPNFVGGAAEAFTACQGGTSVPDITDIVGSLACAPLGGSVIPDCI